MCVSAHFRLAYTGKNTDFIFDRAISKLRYEWREAEGEMKKRMGNERGSSTTHTRPSNATKIFFSRCSDVAFN